MWTTSTVTSDGAPRRLPVLRPPGENRTRTLIAHGTPTRWTPPRSPPSNEQPVRLRPVHNREMTVDQHEEPDCLTGTLRACANRRCHEDRSQDDGRNLHGAHCSKSDPEKFRSGARVAEVNRCRQTVAYGCSAEISPSGVDYNKFLRKRSFNSRQTQVLVTISTCACVRSGSGTHRLRLARRHARISERHGLVATALDRRRDPQRLAVLRDGAPRDVDTLFAQNADKSVIRQYRVWRLGIDQAPDPVPDRF